MDEDHLRTRIREKLRNGALPRDPGVLAPAAALVPGRPCSACEEADPSLILRYPAGAVLHLHSLCYRIWDDERKRRG